MKEEMTISGAHARPPEKTLQWEVAAATLLDRGDPAQGVEEVLRVDLSVEEVVEQRLELSTVLVCPWHLTTINCVPANGESHPANG